MRKEFKLASVAGAIFMASSSAFAALPGGVGADGDAIRFQNILKADGKTVDLPTFCTQSSGNCFEIARGDGFIQLMVAGTNGQVAGGIPSGEVYIYTFIAEGATANDANYFRDMSFVQMSSNNPQSGTSSAIPGIYGRQVIKEPDTNGSFFSETNLAVGEWAKTGSGMTADITLKQTLDDNGGDNDTVGNDFKTTFDFASVTTKETVNGQAVTKVSKTMDIGQWLGLEDFSNVAKGSQAMTAGDAQAFAYRSRSGSYNPKAGAAGVGRTDANGNKLQVTWDAGDQIAATWIGQSMHLPEADFSRNFMNSDFAYLSYQNKSKTGNNTEFKVSFATDDAKYNFDAIDNGLWKAEFDNGTTVDRTYFGYEPCLAASSVIGSRTSADPACTKTGIGN